VFIYALEIRCSHRKLGIPGSYCKKVKKVLYLEWINELYGVGLWEVVVSIK
jgi:hypothetical protein